MVYSVNAGGTPTVSINTRDGITTADKVTVAPNTHAHYNWAFTAKGFYQITLQASGTLVSNNQVILSPPATFFFGVEASPYTYANWSAGYETTHNLAANSLGSFPLGDPDRDGLANAVEYTLQWMGADPMVPNFGLLNVTQVGGQLAYDYIKDSLKTTYKPRPQTSANLTTWFRNTDSGAPTGFSDLLNEARTAQGTVEQRRVTLDIQASPPTRGFLRLQAAP